jgi:pimeloyl-ACP methyl ester carboxylesterase
MKFLVSACIYFGFQGALIAEVASLSWDSKFAAPVQTLAGDAQKLLPAFRFGLSTLPEPAIVTLALSQPALLGLSQSQSAALAPLVAAQYERIAASPEFSAVSSQLPYCYSDARPTRGSALVRIPAGATPKSPVIVFIHGYGGSFLWYLHWLSEALPDHIIVAPAYGISPADLPADYLREAIAAASQRLGFQLPKPSLVGLSAGGFGACRAFLEAPETYERLICLAAYPPNDTVRRFGRGQSVHFIAGSREPFVTSGQLATLIRTVRTSSPAAAMTLIPDADHFFMLSHPEEARKALKSALSAANPAAGSTANSRESP